LLSLLGGALTGCGRSSPTVAEVPPPAVQVSKPIEREVIDYDSFTGRTAAVQSVEIRARVSGYLEKIHFRDGFEVAKGDPLFEIDPRPYQTALAQTKGNLASAEARLKRQDADLARAQRLIGTNAISQEDFDSTAGDRAETAASIEALRSAVERAKLDLNFAEINAPISGRIDETRISAGNLVTADSTLLTTIVSLDPIWAYFDADEASVLRQQKLIREKKVMSAREAKIPVYLGLADEPGYPHEGVIDFVSNQLNPGTGTLRVRGIFPNEDRVLSPGLFVRIRIPIGQARPALLVTERALATDQGQKILYVVDDKNEVVSRSVRLGALHDGLRVIEDGLSSGELVIVNGLQYVRPGVTVEPKLVDMPGSNAPIDGLPDTKASKADLSTDKPGQP
jgi:RND family efflux transporter MFP subunit